jgi:NADP-dependent 3-hydroxy acid dehydrogenase YdfG
MPENRVFLITGASSGIGAATARAAAAAGFRLVLAARSRERLSSLAAELGGSERALAVRCDVTEWEQQQAMVQRALEAFGRIDVVFANAGFGAARGFLNESPEHWRAMVLTNVYGAALTVRATLPPIKETRGHLLLTGSVAGRRALPGSLYSATKWAITSDQAAEAGTPRPACCRGPTGRPRHRPPWARKLPMSCFLKGCVTWPFTISLSPWTSIVMLSKIVNA